MQVLIEPVIQEMGISGQHWHLQEKGWYCTLNTHRSKYISSILYFGDIFIIVYIYFAHNNIYT